jgi:hypothetical protein
MPKLSRLFLAALLGLSAMFVSGCGTTEEEDAIPQSRPMSWEGGIPGMTPSDGAGR